MILALCELLDKEVAVTRPLVCKAAGSAALLGMRFTPQEADAIIGIALEVHGSYGIEGCS